MNVSGIKKIIMFVLLLAIITISNQVTLAYLLDKTSPLVSKFIPGDYPLGGFTINKNVEHSLGDDYVIPESIEFEFTIDLGRYYMNQVISTSLGNFETDENGVFSVKIKPDVGITVNGIEEGTKVKITDVSNLVGFTNDKENVREITVSLDENVELKFNNTYTPELVTGKNVSLDGVVKIDGREWQDGDEFILKLEHMNEQNKWIELSSKKIVYDSKNVDFSKFNFNDIIQTYVFKNVGFYKFRVSEVVGNLENVDYDKTINNFEIVVSDKTMDGKLEIDSVTGTNNIVVNKIDSKFEIMVTFNNKYKVSEDSEIEYVDKVEDSILVEDIILVKEDDYTIETVVSKFDGLSDNYTYTIYDKDDNVYKDGLVRTGDYIVIKDNNKEYRYDVVLSGDTSGDGLVTPLDYVKIKNHIIGNNSLPGSVYELAADMSGDGDITPLDYVKVKNYILNGGN